MACVVNASPCDMKLRGLRLPENFFISIQMLWPMNLSLRSSLHASCTHTLIRALPICSGSTMVWDMGQYDEIRLCFGEHADLIGQFPRNSIHNHTPQTKKELLNFMCPRMQTYEPVWMQCKRPRSLGAAREGRLNWQWPLGGITRLSCTSKLYSLSCTSRLLRSSCPCWSCKLEFVVH